MMFSRRPLPWGSPASAGAADAWYLSTGRSHGRLETGAPGALATSEGAWPTASPFLRRMNGRSTPEVLGGTGGTSRA